MSLVLVFIALAGIWQYLGQGRTQPQQSGETSDRLGRSGLPPTHTESPKQYLFDVTDHSPEELSAMLMRAEQLSRMGGSREQPVAIAMVLHGPDIEIFARRNYPRFQHIVDTARRLEQQGVIDFKVCQRVMSQRGITQMELPDFLEPVPYAPDEIKRLLRQGYVTL